MQENEPVYDMYPWNQPGRHRDTEDAPAPRRRSKPGQKRARSQGEAVLAVQEALDRRDNGGDSTAPA